MVSDKPTKFVDREGRVVEEGTPVPRRKTPHPNVSESLADPPGLTVAVDGTTRPHRPGDTEKLGPSPFEERRSVGGLLEPTTILDAATTVAPSADAPAAEPDFDRVEWSADRLGSVAEALRVDGRPRTADLVAGLHAGMVVGNVRGALQKVTSRLVQRALLADANVGDLDDQELAKLLFELAADVLVGVEPMRRASRELANDLQTRAHEIGKVLTKAEMRGDVDAVAEHRGRLDEITATVKTLRRATR